MSDDTHLHRLSHADRLRLLAFDAQLRQLPRPLLDALWAGVDAVEAACVAKRPPRDAIEP